MPNLCYCFRKSLQTWKNRNHVPNSTTVPHWVLLGTQQCTLPPLTISPLNHLSSPSFLPLHPAFSPHSHPCILLLPRFIPFHHLHPASRRRPRPSSPRLSITADPYIFLPLFKLPVGFTMTPHLAHTPPNPPRPMDRTRGSVTGWKWEREGKRREGELREGN